MVAPRKRSRRCQSSTAWHAAFLAMVPAIHEQALFAFRHLRLEAKEEAIEEVICNACVAFHRLVKQGKADLGYPTPLAQYAIKQVRDDRKVGSRRSIRDVMHPFCQRKKGVKVERLDRFDEEEGCWLETIVEDRRAGPAETVEARLDLGQWFDRMPARRRKIAQALAVGSRTSDVARRFRVTPGRIAQMRRWFATDWQRFNGGEA